MRRIATVGVVMLGLYAFVQSTAYFAYPMSILGAEGLSRGQTIGFVAIAVLPFVVAVAAGVILIAKRRSLVDWLIDDESADLAIDAQSLLAVGLGLVGVWLLAWSIPGIVGALVQPVMNTVANKAVFGEQLGATYYYFPQVLGNLAGPILRAIAGLLLALFPVRIAGRMWRGAAPGHRVEQALPADGGDVVE